MASYGANAMRFAAVLLALGVVMVVQNRMGDRTEAVSGSMGATEPTTTTTEMAASAKAATYVLWKGPIMEKSRESAVTAGLRALNKYYIETGNKLAGDYSPSLGTIVQVYDEHTRFSLTNDAVAYWYVNDKLVTETPTEELVHVFYEVGHYELKAVTVDTADVFVFDINAKIVRWELRDLTDEDRNRYFLAVHKMYQFGQQQGQDMYGSNFNSAAELVRIHLMGAADKSCDHWHDDMGMVNHHVAITWKFEQSLRMIDPYTASHYWDYTRSDDVPWKGSNIFDDDWFSAGSPTDADHIVATGRFAYLPIMTNARKYSSITNPYGILRSPWNTNNIPYLMRYNSTIGLYADGFGDFPLCDMFAEAVDGDMGYTVNQLNGNLHGPVHIMVGGHWGMGKDWESIVSTALVAKASDVLLSQKFMWRQGIIRTPTYCSSDTALSDCQSSCPDEIVGDMTPDEMLDLYVGNLSDVWTDILRSARARSYSDTDIKNFMCNTAKPGEMFTSAAPQDPLFWPLHGNAERFIALKERLMEEGYISFNNTWAYQHSSNNPSDTHVVCDWTGTEGLDLPKCSTGTCPGHRAYDLIPFTGLMSDDDNIQYTNFDFFQLIGPSKDKTPYVYDALDFWENCDSQSMYQTYVNLDDDDGDNDGDNDDGDDDDDDDDGDDEGED